MPLTHDKQVPAAGWTHSTYELFRVLLGAYLFVHFAQLLPYAAELFGESGMLSTSPLLRAFPNVLSWSGNPVFVTAFVGSGLLASLFVMVGQYDRIAAVYAWFVLACLFGRNPFIRNPSLPYVGVVLLCHALTSKRGSRPVAASVTRCVWLLLGAGYFYSAVTKLGAPSWADGSALDAVLHNPLARPGAFRTLLLSLPLFVRQAASYGTLVLEAGFIALIMSRRLRPWAWLAMVLLHLQLILLIDFADLSIGMLIAHAFVFDPSWLRLPARASYSHRRRRTRLSPSR